MSAEHAGITNRKTVLEKSADRLGGGIWEGDGFGFARM